MHAAEAGAVMDTFGKDGGGRKGGSRSSSKEREAEVINIPKVYPAAHQSCHGQIWVARRQTAKVSGSLKAISGLKVGKLQVSKNTQA